jgi:hypothetical protein
LVIAISHEPDGTDNKPAPLILIGIHDLQLQNRDSSQPAIPTASNELPEATACETGVSSVEAFTAPVL